jgi:hypothetical protein
MSNRKEVLIKKYAELISNLSSVGFSPSLFPSLDDLDVVDLLLLFNFYFASTDDYEPKIRELAQIQGIEITEEEYQKGLPIIINYINWLKLFQKS